MDNKIGAARKPPRVMTSTLPGEDFKGFDLSKAKVSYIEPADGTGGKVLDLVAKGTGAEKVKMSIPPTGSFRAVFESSGFDDENLWGTRVHARELTPADLGQLRQAIAAMPKEELRDEVLGRIDKLLGAPPTHGVDSQEFSPTVSHVSLNPAVTTERQKATFERVFQRGRQLVSQGKIPVLFVDHHLTGLLPISTAKKGLEQLAKSANIPELKDVEAALKNGTLKSLPGYTEQASDHWRQQHPELVAKYPALANWGGRLNINYWSFPVGEATANAGLVELLNRWKLETDGKGEVVFGGAGRGSVEELKGAYERAGIQNPDVRLGSPSFNGDSSKAERMAQEYNRTHPNEEPVVIDHDSWGKAGFIEQIEQQQGPNGEPKVLAAMFDDRLHNRLAAAAASKEADGVVMVKTAIPGFSFAQNDHDNPYWVSTFSPNPK